MKGQSKRVGRAQSPFEAAGREGGKKVQKHLFELYRNIRPDTGPVTGGQFPEQRQFHGVQAKPGVLIQCLNKGFKQLLLSGNST